MNILHFIVCAFYVSIGLVSCVKVETKCPSKNPAVSGKFKTEVSKFTENVDKIINCALTTQRYNRDFENCVTQLGVPYEIEQIIFKEKYFSEAFESNFRIKSWAVKVIDSYCDVVRKEYKDETYSSVAKDDIDQNSIEFDFKTVIYEQSDSSSDSSSSGLSNSCVYGIFSGFLLLSLAFVVIMIILIRRIRQLKELAMSASQQATDTVIYDKPSFVDQPPMYGQIRQADSKI
jgi:hypothetical protein